MAYEKIVSVPNNTQSNQVPISNGAGGFTWNSIPTADKAYVASATAPSDHDKLWIDTTESGSSGSGEINYSTTVQDTGLKWIDGRTVYQITINDKIEANSGQTHFTDGGRIGGNGAPTIIGVDGVYRLSSYDDWKQFNGLFFNQSMGVPEWCYILVEGGFEMAIPMIYMQIRNAGYNSVNYHPEISLLLTIRYVEN